MQQWIVAIGLNSAFAIAGLLAKQKALTRAGLLHAWALGVIVWGCLGWCGYAIVAVYFLLGTAVTKIGIEQKEAKGIAEKRGGARGPENVWGSALTGAICAIAALIWPSPLWLLAYTASFAAKLADTTSSEIGKAYGKRTFLITSLKPVPPGSEGAVSLEGTAAGWLAAALLSAIGVGLYWQQMSPLWLLLCWLAAVIATTVESWMGATIQPQFAWLTNEVINGIQTTIAAAIAIVLAVLLGGQS